MQAPTNAALVVEDLTQGLNEWRNIQDIVRLTFKAFHDVLRAQGETIKVLERNIDTKASRAEVSTSLQQKANASDMAGRLRELETLMATKADISDMERRALKTEMDASLRTQMTDLYALLRSKAEDSEFKAYKEHVDRQLAALRADVTRLSQGLEGARQALDTKAGLAEVSQALSLKADLVEVDDKLRDKVSRKVFTEALSRKADVSQLDQLEGRTAQELADLGRAVARKADAGVLEEVSGRVERLRQRVEADSDTTAAALRTISATFDTTLADVRSRLEGCATQLGSLHRNMSAFEQQLRDVDTTHREALAKKADAVEVYRLLDKKADAAAVAEALSHKAAQDTVVSLMSKVDNALDLAGRLDALQREVDIKMGEAKDLFAALEGVARVEDVNKALLEVCSELENKAPMAELVRIERQQGVINSGFAQNLHLARWLWRGARTKAGGAVPWEVQAVNTDTDNYIWEEGKATVMLMAPGLYEVSLGFYNPSRGGSRKPPLVQLLVNGEIVLTATPNTLHHVAASMDGRNGIGVGGGVSSVSGRASPLSYNNGMPGSPQGSMSMGVGGNVTGLTAVDVLLLPPKAKVAITYQGDDRAEGFLSLRKL